MGYADSTYTKKAAHAGAVACSVVTINQGNDMFVAVILLCGMHVGPLGCQAIVNVMTMPTEAECVQNVRDNIPAIQGSLPPGAYIADFECAAMSIAG